MPACQYCGHLYESFQPICSQCGAPIPKEISPEQLELENEILSERLKVDAIADRAHWICNAHFAIPNFQKISSIPEKKVQKIKKAFRVYPTGKEVFLYCDTSPMNNGKRGFMICGDGIYWQNHWSTPTNRNFLPWEDFMEREIVLKKYDLEFGFGDTISLAGLGSKVLMGIIVDLFRKIKDA